MCSLCVEGLCYAWVWSSVYRLTSGFKMSTEHLAPVATWCFVRAGDVRRSSVPRETCACFQASLCNRRAQSEVASPRQTPVFRSCCSAPSRRAGEAKTLPWSRHQQGRDFPLMLLSKKGKTILFGQHLVQRQEDGELYRPRRLRHDGFLQLRGQIFVVRQKNWFRVGSPRWLLVLSVISAQC